MYSPGRLPGASAARRLLFAALAVSVWGAAAQSEPRDAPSWNRSGRRVALSSLERGSAKPLPGAYTWFSSANEVRALALENDTLWIGTEGGLFAMSLSLDVIEPVSGPASISVRALASIEGALWVGGDHAVSSRSAGRWRHYSGDSNSLFSRVRSFAPGDGRLWIGAFGAGFGYVAGDAATFVSSSGAGVDQRVLAIAEESPTTIYFGTASGLMCADTSGWKSLRYGSRLPIGPVESLAFDEENGLFCAISGRGAAIYSFGRVRTFDSGPGTPGANVHGFSIDPSTRRMWAAGDDGVFVFDGAEWAAQELRGIEARRRFLSIKHDEEGTCYLGTDAGTVVVVTRSAAREIKIPQMFPERRVARLRSADGAVWCIAGGRVFVNRGSFAPAAEPPALYAGEMRDLAPIASNELWLATRFGILKTAGRTWDAFDRRNGLPTEHFIRVARDPAGTFWFASASAGVVSLHGGAWTSYTREHGLPSNEIADLVVDGAGAPWVLTRSGDVARFSGKTWERVPLGAPSDKTASSRPAPDSTARYDPAMRFLGDVSRGSASSPAHGGGRLGLDRAGSCLIAAGAGVYRLGANGFVLLELPERFRGTRPTAILGSSRGEIWLGTAGDGLLVHRGGGWICVTAADGLSDDYIRSLCEDSKGNVWIATQAGGLTLYAPPRGK